MSQFFTNNIPPLVVASTTSLTLAATNNGQPTSMLIGGQGYALTTGLTLNTGTVGLNGIDTGSLAANTLYYIFAVVSSGVVGMVISLSSSAPTGFTQYANIGRCRTFLGSAGLAAVANWLNGQLMSAAVTPLGDIGITASGFGTPTVAKYDCTRIGNQLLVDFFFVSGTVAATTAAINLPTGYALDFSKLSTTASGQIVGSHTSADPSASAAAVGSGNKTGINFTDGTTNNKIFLTINTASAAFTKANGSTLWNTSSSMTGQIRVPIAEFVGLYS